MTGNELDFNEKRRKKNMNKSNMDDSQDDFFEEPEVWINSILNCGGKCLRFFEKIAKKKIFGFAWIGLLFSMKIA